MGAKDFFTGNDSCKIEVPNTLQEAIGIICQVLDGFSFDTKEDELNYISALITPFVRKMIDGPIPMINIESCVLGCGKTIARIVEYVYGCSGYMFFSTELHVRHVVEMSISNDYPVCVFESSGWRAVKSDSVCMAITCGNYSIKRLGGRVDSLKSRTMFIHSGSSKLGHDLARRCVTVRIGAAGEGYVDITKWVIENRGKILGSILKLVNSWIRSGKPIDDKMPRMESYDSWSNVVMAIVYNIEREASILVTAGDSYMKKRFEK